MFPCEMTVEPLEPTVGPTEEEGPAGLLCRNPRVGGRGEQQSTLRQARLVLAAGRIL